ncbi:MAG: UDP-3-O-acyl-N-acetylglucosamine deacetylase [Boseongicola sp.]|nr:MAG: UDP-3-O-acyl-N-acetylglucosamine deacetylase [Boseongicola sp.]
MQTTLKAPVTFTGKGLHSGRPVRMTLLPASAQYGIWFRRTDIDVGDAFIPAKWDAVSDMRLCSKISNASGATVSTVEHIMAALAGCGVHNTLIEIDGPEVPILDGSSAQFVSSILERGLVELNSTVHAIKVLKPVKVQIGDSWARLSPAENLTIDFHIDFVDAAIGRQEKSLNMANGAFVRELCDSRTFCRMADVEAMREQGLIVGGDLASAVVVDEDKVVTPGGMRHADEPVRHKMLDALGDLYLAGAPILGKYEGHRAGHAITNKLLRALFADPTTYKLEECDQLKVALLPGSGIQHDDHILVAS